MLGKLFNNRSTESFDAIKAHNIQIHSSSVTPANNITINELSGPCLNSSKNCESQEQITQSHEDSYTKIILYGTPNNFRMKFLEPYHFRLLIIHDKGEPMVKNNYTVHYDSAKEPHFNKSYSRLSNRHDMKELNEGMFGNQVNQDLNRSSVMKLHILSALPDLKRSVLLTRLFYIKRKHKFAIAIVIPIGSECISQVLVPNWTTLSHHINLLTNIFKENHISKKANGIISKNLDISIFFKQFIKTFNCLANIPRLFIGLINFDSILRNWCLEVNNWIEVKDGAKLGFSGSKFLNTLLTVIYDVRDQLVNNKSSDEFVRVVIMASNPIVAQKLIFILSGILPCRKLDLNYDTSNLPLNAKDEHTGYLSATDSNLNPKTSSPLKSPESTKSFSKGTPPTPSVISKGWEIPTTPSRSIATPSIMTPSRSSIIQPTSLSNSSSMQYLSSSLSSSSTFSSSLSRGFQLLQNWKNSVDISSNSTAYRVPSPSNDYDEYPWNTTSVNYTSNPSSSSSCTIPSTTTTFVPVSHHHNLSRTSSTYDLTSNVSIIPKCLKKLVIPRLPHIERTSTSLIEIGASQGQISDSHNKTRKNCLNLMRVKKVFTELELDTLKGVGVLEVPFEDNEDNEEEPDPIESLGKMSINNLMDEQKFTHTLPPLCGYVHEFLPDFQLQACPVSQDLEAKIVSSMKSDLNNYNNSRTVFVSLRAREIKDIHLLRKQNEYKSGMKKLYYGGRVSSTIDKASSAKIDDLLNSIVSIFRDDDADDTRFDQIRHKLDAL